MPEGMANRTKHLIDYHSSATHIGRGSIVDGDLVFSGCLVVDGKVTGFVMATPSSSGSMLLLSEGASIGGDIHVQGAVVLGSIGGAAHVAGHAELGMSARIMSDLRCESVEIQHGAFVGGDLLIHTAFDK